MISANEQRCKNCEALLDLSKAINGVVECEYCHSVFTVTKEETTNAARELITIAEHELDTCAFDRAYNAYFKAAQEDANEPEAYFGMALSEFKVQYLKDAERKHLQPICHDVTDKSFKANKNCKRAIELATSEQRKVYTQRAEEIDEISAEFCRLKNSGVRYDCFICVKVSDGNGGNTQDSYEALKLYNHLKKRGYNPFYSEEEVRGRTGVQYEALILYALYTSECMLVVCSNEEYLQTPWVKNEYTRFMELINDERKDVDAITIVFNGKAVEKLPGKRALIQGVNLTNPDAYTTIEDYVESHTPESRERREQERARKEREAEEIRKQTEEIKRQMEEQDRARKELEDRLKNIQSGAAAPAGGASATVNSLLMRANQFLADGDFANANEYYNKVLDADPQSGEAWWGLMLVEFAVRDENGILNNLTPQLSNSVEANKNCKKADAYAKGKFRDRVEAFKTQLHSPERWRQLFLKEISMGSEEEVLERISQPLIDSVRSSAYYANWNRFADDIHKKKIRQLEDGLVSGETYWKLFFQEFGARHEVQLLSAMTPEKADKILKSRNYLAAKREASGELSNRIARFDELFKDAVSKDIAAMENTIEDNTAQREPCLNEIAKLDKELKAYGNTSKLKQKNRNRDDSAFYDKFWVGVPVAGIIIAIVAAIAALGISSGTRAFGGLIESLLLSALIGIGIGGAFIGLACLLVLLPHSASYKNSEKKLNNVSVLESKRRDKYAKLTLIDKNINTAQNNIKKYNELLLRIR